MVSFAILVEMATALQIQNIGESLLHPLLLRLDATGTSAVDVLI